MRSTIRRVVDLIDRREVRISDHGYDELARDGILVREVVAESGLEKSLKITRTTRKGRRFWFCSEIPPVGPFTWFGASREAIAPQPC